MNSPAVMSITFLSCCLILSCGDNDTESSCVPAAEVCNGVDDDCDGATDEELAELTCGVGACQRSVPSCRDGISQTCTAGSPAQETCNGVDDDCDGAIDEEISTATCGIGACERTGTACVDGKAVDCTPGDPAAEMCNGIDDDCDGATDEELTATCGIGACERTISSCENGQPVDCTPGDPAAETCNGVDDDCDGATDEDLEELTCGVGSCARTAPACTNGAPGTCVPGQPAPEVCNGVDDDCDGATDEGCPSPEVLQLFPANGAVLVDARPTFSAEFSDEQFLGIDQASVRLAVDGVDVTPQAEVSLFSVRYQPPVDMSPGTHTVEVEVSDVESHTTTRQSTFSVDPDAALAITNRFDRLEVAVAGELYVLLIETRAALPPSYSLPQAPSGMTVDSEGLVQWTPTALQGGEHPVTIRVDDGARTAERSFTIRVATLTPVISSKITAAQGGKIAVTDPQHPLFGVAVEIPADALAQDTTVTLSAIADPPPPEAGTFRVGPLVHLSPEGVVFTKPVTVVLPYAQALLPQAGSQIQVMAWQRGEEGDGWVIADLFTDDGSGIALCATHHFSIWSNTVQSDPIYYTPVPVYWYSFYSDPFAQQSNGHFRIDYPYYLLKNDMGYVAADMVNYSTFPDTPARVIDLAYALEHSHQWYGENGYGDNLPWMRTTATLKDVDYYGKYLLGSITVSTSFNKDWKQNFHTASHEFFHAVQATHLLHADLGLSLFSKNKGLKWLKESTAEYIPEEVWESVTPDLDQYITMVRHDFAAPTLTSFGDEHEYASAVFYKYDHPVDLVKQLWGNNSIINKTYIPQSGYALKKLEEALAPYGGLAPIYLDFVHKYHMREGISEIDKWVQSKLKLKTVLYNVSNTSWEQNAVYLKKNPNPGDDQSEPIPIMSGRTVGARLSPSKGSSLDDEFKGRALVLKFNELSDTMIGRLCLLPANTCEQLDGKDISAGHTINLGRYDEMQYEEAVYTTINSSFDTNGACHVVAYVSCSSELRGNFHCVDPAGTKHPVSNVEVTLENGADQQGQEVTVLSDASGQYVLGAPGNAVYFDCDATPSLHWVNNNVPISWPIADPAVGDITTVEDKELEQLTDVEGVVVDDQGTPVSGAAVTLKGLPDYSAVTQADGSFQIASVNACGLQQVEVEVSHPIHGDGTKSAAPVISGTTSVGNVYLGAALWEPWDAPFCSSGRQWQVSRTMSGSGVYGAEMCSTTLNPWFWVNGAAHGNFSQQAEAGGITSNTGEIAWFSTYPNQTPITQRYLKIRISTGYTGPDPGPPPPYPGKPVYVAMWVMDDQLTSSEIFFLNDSWFELQGGQFYVGDNGGQEMTIDLHEYGAGYDGDPTRFDPAVHPIVYVAFWAVTKDPGRSVQFTIDSIDFTDSP